MITALNRVVALIEDDLTEDLDVSSMARAVGTTEHHLRRMFSSLAGLPLSEYVRRRRMTVAAAEVVRGEADLLTIAVRHGYGSAEAFARAFRGVHGAGPSDVRRHGGPIRSQPVLRFSLQVEGGEPMDTRIVDLPAFRLAGRAARVPLVYEDVNPHIQQVVQGLTPEEHRRIERLGNARPHGLLAVVDDVDPDRAEGSELTFLHGVAVTEETATPADLDAIDVPAGRWLIVEAGGPQPQSLQKAWADTWSAWFPANPWRLRPGPEITARLALHEGGAPADVPVELWLPIEPA